MEEDIADPDNEPSGHHSNKFKWPPVAVSFLSSFNFLYQVLILLLGWSHIVIALYVTLLFPSVYKYSDLAFTVSLSDIFSSIFSSGHSGSCKSVSRNWTGSRYRFRLPSDHPGIPFWFENVHSPGFHSNDLQFTHVSFS